MIIGVYGRKNSGLNLFLELIAINALNRKKRKKWFGEIYADQKTTYPSKDVFALTDNESKTSDTLILLYNLKKYGELMNSPMPNDPDVRKEIRFFDILALYQRNLKCDMIYKMELRNVDEVTLYISARIRYLTAEVVLAKRTNIGYKYDLCKVDRMISNSLLEPMRLERSFLVPYGSMKKMKGIYLKLGEK